MCDIFIIYIAKCNRYIHKSIIILLMLQTRNNDEILNSHSTSSVQRCFFNCIVQQYLLTNGYYTEYHICYDDWIPPNLRSSECEKQNIIIILGTRRACLRSLSSTVNHRLSLFVSEMIYKV